MTINSDNKIPDQDFLEICRNDYIAFAKYIWPHFQSPRHVVEIAKLLTKVERGEVRKMILTLPPRHSKSFNVSWIFPLWYIGRHPNHYIIVVTSTQALAQDAGIFVKARMQEPEFQAVFPEFKLSKDTRKKSHLGTAKGGMIIFTGRNGTIQGRGAHLLVVDDLVTATEADSELIQKQVWLIWQQVLLTRLQPGGRTVVLQQRLRHNDLVGMILDPATSPHWADWEVCNFPALATEENADWRKPGEPLWPRCTDANGELVGFDAEHLLKIRAEKGTQVFEALYQQNPSPSEGSLWHSSHITKIAPDSVQLVEPVVAFADTATSAKTSADFSAVVVAARTTEGDIFITHSWHARKEFPELVEWVQQIAAAQAIDALLVEQASSGIQLIQILKNQLTIPVVGFIAKGDKVQRASAVLPLFQSGKIKFSSAWDHQPLFSEMLQFPYAKHDDLVDAMVGAITYLSGKNFRSARGNSSGGSLFRNFGWFGR